MIPLIAGFLLLWLSSVMMREFLRANPALVAQRLRRSGGIVCFGIAVLLLVRGEVGIALGLGSIGLWLTGLRGLEVRNPFAVRPRRRRVSRVRSAMIEMELDHATGAMSGVILVGPNEGRRLDEFDRRQCQALYSLCITSDAEGARLLEAYFDRRFTGWRAATEDQRNPRGGGGTGSRPSRAGAMSEDEAYELLGLAKGASREEVARAHRALMKKFHPDHGGSTDLAARVNEAKDVLMRRHL